MTKNENIYRRPKYILLNRESPEDQVTQVVVKSLKSNRWVVLDNVTTIRFFLEQISTINISPEKRIFFISSHHKRVGTGIREQVQILHRSQRRTEPSKSNIYAS